MKPIHIFIILCIIVIFVCLHRSTLYKEGFDWKNRIKPIKNTHDKYKKIKSNYMIKYQIATKMELID